MFSEKNALPGGKNFMSGRNKILRTEKYNRAYAKI